MCQGFGHFSGFLRHFVLAKLAISNIRAKVLQRTGAAHCCCHEEGAVVVSRDSREEPAGDCGAEMGVAFLQAGTPVRGSPPEERHLPPPTIKIILSLFIPTFYSFRMINIIINKIFIIF